MPVFFRDKQPLKITSINIEGIKGNSAYVSQLLAENTIICLQEHWLFSFESKMLYNLFPTMDIQIKCVDDSNPISSMHRPRGTAGVATLWPKSISKSITPLVDGSDRVAAIKVHTVQGPLIVINTYMPASGTRSGVDYNSVLDEVLEISRKYGDCKMLWTGDINASHNRLRPSDNDRKFAAFCLDNKFEISHHTPSVPTYHHFTGNTTSTIDYFIVPNYQMDFTASISVNSRNPANCSAHDAIIATLSLRLQEPIISLTSKSAVSRRVMWDRVDIDLYVQRTEEKLTVLYESIAENTPTELVANRLSAILLDVSSTCSPQPPSRPRNKTKYTWCTEVKPDMMESKMAHARWKHGGRPTDPQNTLCLEKKLSKQKLRSTQRCIAARERQGTYTKIMEASERDQITFHRLVRGQREHKSTTVPDIVFKKDTADDQIRSPADNWAKYFESLASPKNSDTFCCDQKKSSDLQRLLMRANLRNACDDVSAVSTTRIQEHISRLKNGKASDALGVSAEHIKLAAPIVTDVITLLANRILIEGKVPESFKDGLISPVHKKDKPVNDPDSYRRITVTSIVAKVIEKELTSRMNQILSDSQSPHQFGFTEGVSSNNAAVLLTEAIADAKTQRQPLQITFMDASKAFDVVDHSSMLRHLYNRGVCGKLWLVMDDLYTGTKSAVKWDGQISPTFAEEQGIRQGGVSSTTLFNNRSTPLLNRLSSCRGSFRIGCIPLGPIMCADDLALLSDTSLGMQYLVNEAGADASRERYSFSMTKTKSIASKEVGPNPIAALLYGNPLQFTKQEKHLGIIRTVDGKCKETVKDRIQTARRTAYSLMSAGLHGLNGISPGACLKVFDAYVTPRLVYGLETLVIDKASMKVLETFYRHYLRCFQHLPESTASPAIYLLIGATPLEAQIHLKVLTSVASMARRPDSLEAELLQRQIAMKDSKDATWVTMVRQLLMQYELPTLSSILKDPPTKGYWKNLTRRTVSSYWETQLKEEAEEMSSLIHIALPQCSVGRTHPVYQLEGRSCLEVAKAAVKAKLLVSRYPLYTSRVSGRQYGKKCPLCKTQEESKEHFLLQCPVLETERQPLLSEICTIVNNTDITADGRSLTQLLLDCSGMIKDKVTAALVEDRSRKLCFQLHHRRCIATGYESPYARVTRRMPVWL
jgi:hypothetical protein